jgi:hypothetical protein
VDRRLLAPLIAALVFVVSLGGCSGECPPARIARVQHFVAIGLRDPGEASALLADIEATLSKIPVVVSFSAGTPLDLGRPEVAKDYSVGLVIGFESEAGYRAYLEHPEHRGILERWGPKVASLSARDFLVSAP